MTKRVCLISSLALALLIIGGGLLWLFLAPAGLLNSEGPEEYMQTLLDESSVSDWEERIGKVWDKPVTVYEDPAEIFSLSFAAAVQEQDFTFREYEPLFRRRAPVYLLSAGENDLCLVRLRHDGGWMLDSLSVPEGLLEAQTHVVSITVPSDASVTLNGLAVDDAFLADEDVPYEDMCQLEKRFDRVPTQKRYEIPGLYRNAQAAASLNGEPLPLVYSDGESWRFSATDAASYSFRILAPVDAEVTVNGAVLTEEDCSGTELLPLDVTVPEELAELHPLCALYSCSGLYSVPEVQVTAADGRTLPVQLRRDGTILYTAPLAKAPDELLEERVKLYLEAYCRYGAHQYSYNQVIRYIVENTELWHFTINSQPSLLWIAGEVVDFHDISVYDYIPMGEDACLCSAHVSCTTTTHYETQDLEMDYQLLCVRTDAGWKVQDMAYQ